MKPLLAALVVVIALGARQEAVFTGTITDDMCAEAGHSHMQMGPTDGECTVACVRAHGAAYVLLVGKTVYALSDQTTPEAFAGQKVKVAGTLDARTRTIRVSSITSAE